MKKKKFDQMPMSKHPFKMENIQKFINQLMSLEEGMFETIL
jgi:hypothetical protein